MIKASFRKIVGVWCLSAVCRRFSLTERHQQQPNPKQQPTATTNRRSFFQSTALVAAIVLDTNSPPKAWAFEGSSVYSGRTPTSQASRVKLYKDRIAADVKDFNRLGAAIFERGELQGGAWIDFFIQLQRQEPDAVGRTYGAQVDLTGQEGSGGAAALLASTFAKPNKPKDNVPAYKKYLALTKTLNPIQSAGKAGDVDKAKKEWTKASIALSEYLMEVEMPSDLSDPVYK